MKNSNVPSFEMLPVLVQKLGADLTELRELIIEQHSPVERQLPNYFGAEECCNLLGISMPTLYLYTSTRKIPFHKKGKRLIFQRQEIHDWIKSGRHKTISEIQDNATLR